MLTDVTVNPGLRLSAPRRAAAFLELLKPVTWFPPMWAFLCGAVSTGVPLGDRPALLLLGVLVTGPLVCGASQVVNDWFDRHVDRLNEPQRPIPSGRVPGRLGLYFAILWSALAMAVAAFLGPLGLAATALAMIMAWAYSAPPLRLKQNGWWGNLAVGISYESLAWTAGVAVLLPGKLPVLTLTMALLYGLGAHGILTLNDFKAITGDRVSGVRSLPVQLGAQRAALVCCVVMILPQLAVIGLLVANDRVPHAAVVAGVVTIQLVMMRRFLSDVIGRALWYSAFGVPVYVTGMMVTAFGIRTLG
jgi:chlorophyll synthase